MKRSSAIGLAAVASIGILTVQACSEEDATTAPSGGPTTTNDAGPRKPRTAGGDDASADVTETCIPSGGTCACDCTVIGKAVDDSKTCAQPSTGSQQGRCARLCCTGPDVKPDAGGTDSGASDGGNGDGGDAGNSG